MRSDCLPICLFALILLLASCSGKKEMTEDVGAMSADAASTSPEIASSPEEAQTNLADRIDRLVAEADKLPRAEFEPAALAAALGTDPHAHFEWVRDHTSWAPYRGLLRGAQGVMLDRVGSNLDRAVLLGDLLRMGGHAVRLIHATLPEGSARELLAKIRDNHAQHRGAAATAADADGNEGGGDPRSVESRQIRAKANALVESQTAALLAALKDSMPQSRTEDEKALAAMRDHWWIEHEENGKWVALDVLLPDARPGETLAGAATTYPWKAGDAVPQIPDGEWHTVDIRVVIERYEAGDTKESTVLEASLRPAETIDKPLTLTHVPVPWPSDLPDPDGDPQPFVDAALAVKMWFPVIQIGDESVVNFGFTEAGDVLPDLDESLKDISAVGGTQVASGMDMALGGFGAEESVPAATAEWIDYEIRVPGWPSQKLRRPVFDLIGPARRSAKAADFDGAAQLHKLQRFEALWAPTDILLQTSDLTGAFVAHLFSAGLVARRSAFKDVARQKDPVATQKAAAEIFRQLRIWGALPEYALWRSFLAGRNGPLICQPNIAHFRMGRTVAEMEPGGFRSLIDVASNPVGGPAGMAGGGFESRVRQGVADTVAEILALGGDLAMSENTASVFGRLAAENSRGMLISAGDEATARALPWPEDEIARVMADVMSGHVVVVPRQAVMIGDEQRVGWWRVNPESGETVGVMDNGFHAMTEYKLKVILIAAGQFLANPAMQRNADRVRDQLSRPGYAIPLPQVSMARLFELARHLEGDLEFLARRAGGG